MESSYVLDSRLRGNDTLGLARLGNNRLLHSVKVFLLLQGAIGGAVMPAVGKSPFGSVFRGPPSDDRCSGPMQAEAGNIWHRSEKPATGFWRGRSGLSRRQWLLGMLEVGGWTALQGAGPPSAAFADETTPQPELFPRPAPGVEIWDAHVHLDGGTGTPSDRARFLLKYADRMGIRRLILCMGPKFQPDPTPDQLREQNDAVLEAIRVAPDRFLGFVYLNPKHREASLQEIERCVVRGPMVGIKLWVAMRCQEPALDPLMRRAAELRLPVLQHTFFRLGGNLPGESSPDDLVQLAARHPQVNFICAHTGADWERGIRAVRAQKNIWVDICGSDPTAGFVEMAVRELGYQRVIFGSDASGRSLASQLAKVLSAGLPPEAQKAIFRDNIARLIEPVLAWQPQQPPQPS